MTNDVDIRDDEWTLFDDVPREILNKNDISFQKRAPIDKVVIERMSTGFIRAIEQQKLSGFSVRIIDTKTLQLGLPDVYFNSLHCSGNTCYLYIGNSFSGSISLDLHGSPRHPHCDNNGYFCWSHGTRVAEMIKRERYLIALLSLKDVVETFIPSTAYKTPDGSVICLVAGCDREGYTRDKRIDIGDREPRYNEYVCRQHSRICEFRDCDDYATHNHNNYRVCDTHWKDIECPSCGSLVNFTDAVLDTSRRKLDIRGCNYCTSHCSRCGSVMAIEDVHTLRDKPMSHYCDVCHSKLLVSLNLSSLSSTRFISIDEVIECQKNPRNECVKKLSDNVLRTLM